MQTRHAWAVALLSASGVAAAQTSDGIPYFGLQGSFVMPDNARDQERGWGGTLLFGFPLNDYFAPELNVFGQRADRKATGADEGEWGGGLDFAVYPLGRSRWVSPFLLLGGGGLHDYRHYNANTYGYADAGGGLLFNLDQARDVALRIDARRYMVFDDDTDPGSNRLLDTRINAGVQVALGRAQPPPPPPAPAPPPAPIDSDGDGVPDSLDQCPHTPAGAAVDNKGCPLPPPPPRDSDGDGVVDGLDQCPNTPVGMQVDARGCAVQAAKVVVHDINFAFDSSQLLDSSKAELDRIAEGLRGQPGMALAIEGHTDGTGPADYNLKLSLKRASAARDYLVSQGIAGTRLQAQGFGESRPVASNQTREGRAQNRRVEFKVVQP